MTYRNGLYTALLGGLFGGLITLVACGGTAIIDGDNNSGAGANGSATSNASATSSGQVGASVTSSSSGVTTSLCEAACDSLADCGGGPVDCLDGCLKRHEGPCGELHNNWLSCSLGETNTMCGFGPGQLCAPQLEAYFDCSGELAGEVGCSVGPNSCACTIFVSPGIEKGQACDAQGCQCFIGGQVVGSCPQPEPICEVTSGCCAGVLFTGGS